MPCHPQLPVLTTTSILMKMVVMPSRTQLVATAVAAIACATLTGCGEVGRHRLRRRRVGQNRRLLLPVAVRRAADRRRPGRRLQPDAPGVEPHDLELTPKQVGALSAPPWWCIRRACSRPSTRRSSRTRGTAHRGQRCEAGEHWRRGRRRARERGRRPPRPARLARSARCRQLPPRSPTGLVKADPAHAADYGRSRPDRPRRAGHARRRPEGRPRALRTAPSS